MSDELDNLEDPVLNTDFSNVIIIDGLPVIAIERFEKLCGVVRKLFSKHGRILEDGLFLPVEGEPQKTCGYAFIEYETPEMAARAVDEADNMKLDASHTLRVNFWADYDKYTTIEEKYEAPKKSDYESKANLTSWLLDPFGRDQFVVRHSDETQVFWHDPLRKANEDGRTLQYGGEREKIGGKKWTELIVAWSPRGSYLATFHLQGVVLWGGESFEKLGRFQHLNVKLLDFSPNEKYLVTCNGQDKVKKNDPDCIIVWDVRTTTKLRGFETWDVRQKTPDLETLAWPVFKWSHDDQFLARVATDAIQVYQTPGMGLLNKKSIKINGVRSAQWSPTQNLLAYWVPERDNIPCTVALLDIPSCENMRTHRVQFIVDIKMHWQASGDHLCVKLSRMKSKKTMSTQFEIFRVKEKGIPVETLEMNDHIVAFAWEKYGPKFAVIHGPAPDSPLRSVSIYELKNAKLKLKVTVEQRTANCLFWSPTGQHIVFAELGDSRGGLEFFDCQTWESVVQTEHFHATDVEWDPSGRAVISAVCQPVVAGGGSWRNAMENGYKVWSPHGQQLAVVQLNECYQVLWRPRPPTLLSPEQLREIKDNLKDKYWRKFEAEDERIRLGNLSEEQKEKQNLKDEWRNYRNERTKEYEDEAKARLDLRNGVASDDEDDYVWDLQVVEEELERKEEKLQSEAPVSILSRFGPVATAALETAKASSILANVDWTKDGEELDEILRDIRMKIPDRHANLAVVDSVLLPLTKALRGQVVD